MQPCQLQPLGRTLNFSREPGNRNDLNDAVTPPTTPLPGDCEGNTFEVILIKLSVNVYRNFVADSSPFLAYSPKSNKSFTWPECPSTAYVVSERYLDAS